MRKGNRSLYLTALPYTASNHLLPDRTKVFLSITDPDARPKSRTELLVALFHLTPAESRIAMLLAAGEQPPEIAARTRSSYAAVRSHLKSINPSTRR